MVDTAYLSEIRVLITLLDSSAINEISKQASPLQIRS